MIGTEQFIEHFKHLYEDVYINHQSESIEKLLYFLKEKGIKLYTEDEVEKIKQISCNECVEYNKPTDFHKFKN